VKGRRDLASASVQKRLTALCHIKSGKASGTLGVVAHLV